MMEEEAIVFPSSICYLLCPFASSYWLDCSAFIKVRFQTTKIQMLPSNSKLFSWETYDEDVSSLSESSKITASGLLEQLNATRDTSDYLWYITRWVSLNTDFLLDFFNSNRWIQSIFESCIKALFSEEILEFCRSSVFQLWSLPGHLKSMKFFVSLLSSQQLKSHCFLVCMPHSVDISSSESFLRGGNKPSISVHSAGHAVHVFINGQFLGL